MEKETQHSVLTATAPPCPVQLPSLQGPGTMLAYTNMRKRQRKDNENGGASVSGTAKQGEAGNTVPEDDFPFFENEEVAGI